MDLIVQQLEIVKYWYQNPAWIDVIIANSWIDYIVVAPGRFKLDIKWCLGNIRMKDFFALSFLTVGGKKESQFVQKLGSQSARGLLLEISTGDPLSISSPSQVTSIIYVRCVILYIQIWGWNEERRDLII